MDFQVPELTPIAYFRALVESDAQLPLLEAVASLAQDEYPEFDVEPVLEAVDQLQERLKRRIPPEADELQQLRLLNQFFYQELGFAGNVNDYYDPDNSFLHVVLRTRRGIPVSLSVLWLELAQGLGLNVRGVGFPGHFLVKAHLAKGQVVMDPLNGHSLSREELAERLTPLKGAAGLAGDFEVPLGLYLQSCPSRDIVARMLRNLKEIYRSQADWRRLVKVQDRLIVLLPEAWNEYRDRGLAYAEQGRVAQAVDDLETYLHHAAQELDVAVIAGRVAELRRTSS